MRRQQKLWLNGDMQYPLAMGEGFLPSKQHLLFKRRNVRSLILHSKTSFVALVKWHSYLFSIQLMLYVQSFLCNPVTLYPDIHWLQTLISSCLESILIFFCFFINHWNISPQRIHAKPSYLLLSLEVPSMPYPYNLSLSQIVSFMFYVFLFRLPCGFLYKYCTVMLLASLINVWPIQHQ